MGSNKLKNYTPEQERQNALLLRAIRDNDICAAHKALNAGANPDVRGSGLGCFPAIVLAAGVRSVALLGLLEKFGANLHETSTNGQTALMIAAAKGADVAVCFLLVRDARENAQDHDGATALYHAARFGHAGVIRLLRKAGADMNICGPEGTPLMVALNNNQPDAADALAFGRKKLARLKLRALAA